MMARVLTGVRIVLGALFIWAAVTKLPDMAGFAQDVANYRIVPAALVPFVASAVVGIELLGGIALVAGAVERAGAAAIACLVVALIASLSQPRLRRSGLRRGAVVGAHTAAGG